MRRWSRLLFVPGNGPAEIAFLLANGNTARQRKGSITGLIEVGKCADFS